MPNKKAAIKDIKQSTKRAVRNLRVQRNAKLAVKSAREAIETGKDNAAELVKTASKTVDRAARSNVIAKNKAARTKSRLVKALNKK